MGTRKRERRPSILSVLVCFEHGKMKCARNKTAQNMVRDECVCAFRSYRVNFRHLKFGQKCTAKWLLFRHQNYREVFFRFAHNARKNHLHPPCHIPSIAQSVAYNRFDKQQNFSKFVPRFRLLLSIDAAHVVACGAYGLFK